MRVGCKRFLPSLKRYYEQVDGKTVDITKEIPFELPKGWAWCRLKSLCSLITDGTHQTPEYSESGYVFLSSTNVTSGKIDWSNVKYIPEQLHSELYERLSPQFGDILLAKNGTIGCAAIVDRHDIFDIYVSLALLRPFRSAINEKFLHRIIGAPAIQNFFAGEKKGIGLYNLHLENIRQTPIPLPPLAEQKRIVVQIESLLKCVDEIDKESETLEKSITLAKQKILDLAIRGKLVPQDPDDEPASELLKKIKAEKEALIKAGKMKRDKHESFIFRGDDNCYHENIDGKNTDITGEIPFDLPQGWAWCRLGKIAYCQNGYAFSSLEMKKEGEIPVIRISNIEANQISIDNALYVNESEELAIFIVKKGDLLIAMSGATTGKFGIYNRDSTAYQNQRVGNIKLFDDDETLRNYRNLYIATQQALILQIAYGGAQPNISGDKICNLLLPLPPLAEQKRIVSQVEKLFAVLETMRG